MDSVKVCRLCGENAGKVMYNIFGKNEEGQQLIQLIKQNIPVVVYRSDPLSKEICEKCFNNLNVVSQFQTQCINTQDDFKKKLLLVSDNNNVKLYLDALENQLQADYIVWSPPTRRRQVKSCSCQVSLSNFPSHIYKGVNKVKIRSPDLINEDINKNSNILVTATSSDGVAVKKRKLAGPKSKTRWWYPCSPPTLLQCALRKLNENLVGVSEDWETFGRRRSGNYRLGVRSLQDLGVSTEDYNKYFASPQVPAICNYCMKEFENTMDLARHEIVHIQVDVGPRVDDEEYSSKFQDYAELYKDWCDRQFDPDNESEDSDEQMPGTEQVEVEQDAQNLLVPGLEDLNHVFKVVDNEVTVNGMPLKSYDKATRRSLYKSVVINGVKRKFCPVCRHTFKDNWAIDIHYINNSCQYTCKYCGMKFKFHKELYPQHLQTHEGEPCNKIFGPSDRRSKMKKRKMMKYNRFVPHSSGVGVVPKVKPIKMKHLLKKKMATNLINIKTEPGEPEEELIHKTPTLETTSKIQPYQAYFCRKCFKVFFKIDEFNKHTSLCTGTGCSETDSELMSSSDHSAIPLKATTKFQQQQSGSLSKRPQRSCVKDLSVFNDSDNDSLSGSWPPKPYTKKDSNLISANGFECGICCSSFPSRHSRNSHMRIHKTQKYMPEKITNNSPVQAIRTITTYSKPNEITYSKEVPEVKTGNIRLANLNPTVARLVQNNPHLTIRSYTKANTPDELSSVNANDSQEIMQDHSVKRAYRCSDCNGKFENKSLLYYHKMENCVVKRHYECAFCRKKFGSQEQYNTHMLHIHPE